MDEIVLSSEDIDANDPESVIELLSSKIDQMIEKANEDNKYKMKPLIRLKVEYSGFATINPHRFGQRFVGRVANPNELLLFHKRRTTSSHTSSKAAKDAEKDLLLRTMKPDPLDNLKIEDLIESYLYESTKPLEILPEHELNNALTSFVDKDDKSAISEFVNKTLSITRNYLKNEDPEKTAQSDTIQLIVSERTATKRLEEQSKKADEEDEEESESSIQKKEILAKIKLEAKNNKNTSKTSKLEESEEEQEEDNNNNNNSNEDDSDDDMTTTTTKSKGKSKGKSKSKSKGKKSTTKAKSKSTTKKGKKKGNYEPLTVCIIVIIINYKSTFRLLEKIQTTNQKTML